MQIESLKKALGNKENLTPPTKKIMDAVRATSEKPKYLTERTPPRIRRLSIENGSSMALERCTNYDDRRTVKTPSATPPPRARRLSIENGTTMPAGVSVNQQVHHHATRSRRLSLEGPRNVQKDFKEMKSPEVITKPIKPEVRSLQNHRAPRSPLSSALKSPVINIDTAKMKVVPSQTLKTPEPQIKSRNEVQRPLPTDRILSSEIQTPCSTHGKGSQIRKSLRTIGKLINASEKRNQQKSTAATTPFNGTSIMHDPKSPTSSNARVLRRQSLTGIQPPDRRSSIGGIPTDSYGNESRNAKTPPQVRASAKLTKRWL